MPAVSRQPSAPMGPSTDIGYPTVDQRLVDIRTATCLPELNSSRMGEYSDLPHRKMLISVRFIPNYRLGWQHEGKRYEVGHSQDVCSLKLLQLCYLDGSDRKSQFLFQVKNVAKLISFDNLHLVSLK